MKTSIALCLGSILVSGCAAPLSQASPSARAQAAPPAAGAPTSCVTIQRGRTGQVADARIAEAWPNDNYGASEAAFAGVVGKGARRVLIRFGVEEIPRNARITKATITLHRTTNSLAPVTVHRATAAWGEEQVTWSSFADGFERQPLMTLRDEPRPGEDPAVLSFDATELVRAWHDGSEPDHGLVLAQANASTAFATSECAGIEDRPRLEVCFEAGTP